MRSVLISYLKNNNMNQSLESILQIIFAVFCIIFGLDKFLEFLPACSLMSDIPQSGMIATGVIEIIIGIALLLKKYTLTSLRVATAIMIGGSRLAARQVSVPLI